MHNREEILKLNQEMSDAPDMSAEQEYEFYKNNAIRTKVILLETILEAKEYLCVYLNNDDNEYRRSDVFYKKLSELFDKFYTEVETMFLMEPLDDWWGYGIIVRETGISLSLAHYMMFYDEHTETTDQYTTTGVLAEDEEYILHTTSPQLLSLEEFGKSYNVSGNTVRQWIRRGKIREAIKFGNDWRISELADVSKKKGILHNNYCWKETIPNPPEGIPTINDYDNAVIYKNKQGWHLLLDAEFDDSVEKRDIIIPEKVKEKIELYMISNPLISCGNNYYGEVRQQHPLIYRNLGRKEIEPNMDEIMESVHQFIELVGEDADEE